MSLAIGSRLGAYEILGPLGAGGMGEVYRAKDPRLGRDVAIKVLPEEFFESEERGQRFEREARLLAALNHPGIAAIYSFEEIPSSSPSSSSRHILVMELVEGETLRARMRSGVLPPRETLEIGTQIARGLAAAHGQGVIHRDLKPENVVVSKDGRVRILDFGLAKLLPRAAAGEDLTSAGTRSILTEAGAVYGTVGYMSPEQVRGESVDARSDIFSLGTILYEMLAGKNPFRASTSVETMTAILRSEAPPLTEAAPSMGSSLSLIVARCLEKKPERRFQSAEDLAFALEALAGSASVRSIQSRNSGSALWRWAALLAAFGALALGVALLLRFFGPAPAARRVVRFTVAPPDGGSFVYQVEGSFLAVSPDGSRLVYVAMDPTRGQRLWLRSLGAFDATPLVGTEEADSVFFSPDGRSIGFFADNKLKRMDLAGGAPVPVCDVAAGGGKTGTWSRGGDILFAGVQGEAIYRVSAAGGAVPVAILRPDAKKGESRVNWPWFLPDGRHFLYLLRAGAARTLMLSDRNGRVRPVAPISSEASWMDPDFLVFADDGALLGQRFDFEGGRLVGSPVSIADHVRFFFSNGFAAFAASRGGTIAYQSREDTHRLAWFDFSGRETGRVGQPSKLLSVFIPPDGRAVLFARARSDLGTYDVWSYDADRNVETRITSAPESEFGARWLPGGRSIVYSTVRGRNPRLVRRDLATGDEEPLLPAGGFQEAADVSPDGRTLLYFERPDRGSFDLWTLPLAGDGKPVRLLDGTFLDDEARFSPDGRFISIISAESGRREAYVIPYPGPGEKIRVSTRGAEVVRWSRDGRALLYLASDGRFMSVPVRPAPPLQLGEPKVLFALKGELRWQDFDVSADGTRILAVVPEFVADKAPLNVVVNWPSEVQK